MQQFLLYLLMSYKSLNANVAVQVSASTALFHLEDNSQLSQEASFVGMVSIFNRRYSCYSYTHLV